MSISMVTEKVLLGKVAVITGGAAGIGEATVRLFTKHGAKVIIADIADEAGKKLADSLSPSQCLFLHCDVRKEADVKSAVDAAIQSYGHLDVMFNNAGTIDTFKPNATLADYDMEQFEPVMNVNVRGVMNGLKHAARVMIPNKNGSIISTASSSAMVGGTGPYAYTASKCAIIGLTKNAAAELGNYGIRVNCVSPFGVSTALALQTFTSGVRVISEEEKEKIETNTSRCANLKGSTLRAHDIAEAVLFLASENAKYISGHNLVVDGGFTVVNHALGMFPRSQN